MTSRNEVGFRMALANVRDPRQRQVLQTCLFEERQKQIRASQVGYLLLWKHKVPRQVPIQPVSDRVMNSLRQPRIQFKAHDGVLYLIHGRQEILVPLMQAVTTEELALVAFVETEYQAKLTLILVQTMISERVDPAQLPKTVTRAFSTFFNL